MNAQTTEAIWTNEAEGHTAALPNGRSAFVREAYANEPAGYVWTLYSVDVTACPENLPRVEADMHAQIGMGEANTLADAQAAAESFGPAPLTVSEAVSLHDVMGAVFNKSHVRWIDPWGSLREGDIRSLVTADGASVPAGMDVREAHISVTAGVVQTTIHVAYAMLLIRTGGIAFS